MTQSATQDVLHDLMTLEEAAKFLRITRHKLTRLRTEAGSTLPFYPVGRQTRYSRDELLEWSKKQAAARRREMRSKASSKKAKKRTRKQLRRR